MKKFLAVLGVAMMAATGAGAVTSTGGLNDLRCNYFSKVVFEQTGTGADVAFSYDLESTCPGSAAYRGFEVKIEASSFVGWEDFTLKYLRRDGTISRNLVGLEGAKSPVRFGFGGYSRETTIIVEFEDGSALGPLELGVRPIPLPAAAGMLGSAVLMLFGLSGVKNGRRRNA